MRRVNLALRHQPITHVHALGDAQRAERDAVGREAQLGMRQIEFAAGDQLIRRALQRQRQIDGCEEPCRFKPRSRTKDFTTSASSPRGLSGVGHA